MSKLLDKVKKKIGSSYSGIKKCVVAFSGGLDTTVICSLFQEMDIEIVTVTLDIGQGDDIKEIEAKANRFNVSKHYTIDAKKEFAGDFIFPAIKANCLYEGSYPNATALGRPLIVKHLVETGRLENADAVAHGSTGKGNDQVRIDNGVRALSDMKVIAPVRDWELWRDEEIEYAREKNLDVNLTRDKAYSFDHNLWGRSMECGPIEKPDLEVPEDAYELTANPKDAPDEPQTVELFFENGVPIRADLAGELVTDPVQLIMKLNKLAGKHGVGRINHMEDRVVGFKSRESYESPAALAILPAHKDLEKFILTKDELRLKADMDIKFSEMAYDGKWFSPVRHAINAFIDETQKHVNGSVKVRLFKGSATVLSRKSGYSLYSRYMASYDKATTTWVQQDGEVFTRLYGLDYVMGYKRRYGKGK